MLCDLQISSGCVYHLEQPRAHVQSLFLFPRVFIIGSAEALPIVREVRSVRERERDTERERERERRK